MDLRIDDVNKVLAVLDKRNGSEDGGILGMINKSDAMNAKLLEMEKDFKELKKIVRGGANQSANQGTTVQITEGASIQEMERLKETVTSLKKDIDALRNLFNKQNKEVEKQMKFKAELNQLNQLEKVLMDQLNDQMNILNNKIDEAKKIKQQSIKLEQALKKLQEFVFDQLAQLGAQGINGMHMPAGEEEDAMFAKRPLVGWSCASCDKDILNLGGRSADYQPWKMMPMRDPTDRI